MTNEEKIKLLTSAVIRMLIIEQELTFLLPKKHQEDVHADIDSVKEILRKLKESE